jgi:hypothetical protein
LGGRDWEDHGSRLAWVNSKILSQQKSWAQNRKKGKKKNPQSWTWRHVSGFPALQEV